MHLVLALLGIVNFPEQIPGYATGSNRAIIRVRELIMRWRVMGMGVIRVVEIVIIMVIIVKISRLGNRRRRLLSNVSVGFNVRRVQL